MIFLIYSLCIVIIKDGNQLETPYMTVKVIIFVILQIIEKFLEMSKTKEIDIQK